jgi:hypothetical protein
LRPGAILLNLMMPVLDGYAFRAEQLRDPELGAIPVVVCSAAAEFPGLADPLCPAAVLPKPVDLDEVGRARDEVVDERVVVGVVRGDVVAQQLPDDGGRRGRAGDGGGLVRGVVGGALVADRCR